MLNSFKFLEKKYTRWYFDIISNAKNRQNIGYVERHHIIPKCLGGDNTKENLVDLTAREHFICHWLLTKMTDNVKHQYQLWNAFSCMLYRKNSKQERHRVNSKTFENIKKEGSKIKSIRFSGVNNPRYGIKRSEESKKKQSLSAKGRIVTEETREKISKNLVGKKKTLSHKNALSESWQINKEKRTGENSSWFGRTRSEESKNLIRQKILNQPKYSCQNCGKITTKGNYIRWHNNNCKELKEK